MNEAAQQSDTPPSTKLPLSLRVVLFFREPLIALRLLAASILVAIAGAVSGKWEWTLCGIALALAAIGLLALILLLSLETLNGWASAILNNIAGLHDEEIRKLLGAQLLSGIKLGSLLHH